MAEETTEEGGPVEEAGRVFSQAELDTIVGERLARERAKYADYADLKKKAASAMTEQERAVNEAKEAGRSEARQQASFRLVRAEFKAAGKGRIDDAALASFLEYASPEKFLDENGEPDAKAIETVVGRLAGPVSGTSFDGGARTTASKPQDMNAMIRHAAGLD